MARGFGARENRLAEQAKLNVLSQRGLLRIAKETAVRVKAEDKRAQLAKKNFDNVISILGKTSIGTALAQGNYEKEFEKNAKASLAKLTGFDNEWRSQNPRLAEIERDWVERYDTAAGTSDAGLFYSTRLKAGTPADVRAEYEKLNGELGRARLNVADAYEKAAAEKSKAYELQKEYDRKVDMDYRTGIRFELTPQMRRLPDADAYALGTKFPFKQITDLMADLSTKLVAENPRGASENTPVVLYQNPKTKKWEMDDGSSNNWKSHRFEIQTTVDNDGKVSSVFTSTPTRDRY